ncbi:MAG: PhzF family phenazine biosynthesis protein [Polyangiales bacterium]
MSDAQLLAVFCEGDAAGSPTAVLRGVFDDHQAQALATKLGLPATAFVAGERVRFYSPSESLTVCYQALLAAAHVLGAPRTRFALIDRELEVELDGERAWVISARDSVIDGGDVRTPWGDDARVFDTGRKRAYARMSLAQLDSLQLLPDVAFNWLRASGLSGLCLLARDGETLRMRVFTTSLEGHEDVATGGAAAALPALLEHDGPFTIVQGVARRGMLHVKTRGDDVLVGGRVEPLLRGSLL